MVFVKSSIILKEAAQMGNCNQGRLRQQLSSLRRQFLQDAGLPFTNVLSEETVTQALTAVGACVIA